MEWGLYLLTYKCSSIDVVFMLMWVPFIAPTVLGKLAISWNPFYTCILFKFCITCWHVYACNCYPYNALNFIGEYIIHIVEKCYKHLQEQHGNFQWQKRVMLLWLLWAQTVHMTSAWAHQFRSKYRNSPVIKGLGYPYLLTIDLSVSTSNGLSPSCLRNLPCWINHKSAAIIVYIHTKDMS